MYAASLRLYFLNLTTMIESMDFKTLSLCLLMGLILFNSGSCLSSIGESADQIDFSYPSQPLEATKLPTCHAPTHYLQLQRDLNTQTREAGLVEPSEGSFSSPNLSSLLAIVSFLLVGMILAYESVRTKGGMHSILRDVKFSNLLMIFSGCLLLQYTLTSSSCLSRFAFGYHSWIIDSTNQELK